MNPTSEEQLPPPPPPPQPPQPPRSSTSCDRHPDEQFTGFCPSCLCERLAVLDQSSATASTTTTTGRKSASSALKSLFNGPTLRGRPSSNSLLPELRRTQSFSGGKNEGFLGFSGVFEPQRKSCDVRGRNTLFSLFSQDDVKKDACKCSNNQSNLVVESKEEEVVVVEEEEEEEEEEFHDSNDNGDEIQVVEEPIVASNNGNNLKNPSGEQFGEVLEIDLKPMKDHIDLDSQNKKVGSKDFKELAGSFWSAASVFSKKLRAWTKKNNKIKKQIGSHTVQISGKKGRRNYRDTQSEIADYGYGRRSCDTDPRFSLDAGRFSMDAGRFSIDAGRFSVDAGRVSFDDPRCSFDEPRASWDGYLIGRSFPRMMPPMVSVVEDAPPQIPVTASRKDTQIPVEEPRRSSVSINGDDNVIPGGAIQTKDYYSDSSSRRRKSLDRSSSIRKTAAAVVAEMDELKNGNCNGNGNCVVDHFHGPEVNPIPLRDDSLESFETGFRDNASVIGNGDRKESKKPRKWRAWNIWGFIYRRGNPSKDEDDDRYSSRPNGVERSFSESWQEFRREGGYGGDSRAGFNRNMLRSNSSVSWRNSYNNGGSFGSIKKGSSFDANGNGKKKKDEFVLDRNRSARYSPNHADNGLLRFYLTPMKGSRRSGKPKPAYAHSFARSVLRFY